MDPSDQLNPFAATVRASTLHPQQLTQPTPSPQHVPLEHHHQATITPHHLVHRVSGVQLQDGVHIPVTPASMPRLNSSLSPASEVSRPGPIVTQGWPQQSLMPPMMSLPPGFPLPGRDHGSMSGQHSRTPHPVQQQQRFSPYNMAEGSEKVVMADPAPLIIAYPPVKRNIKQEIQDEHQVVNTVEEENGKIQLPEGSFMMEGLPVIAYRPIPRYIKLENLDEHQEEISVAEENWMLQVPKDSVQSTASTDNIIDLPIVDASLPSSDSGQRKKHLRDRRTTMNALEGGAYQDADMTESDSEEEGSEYEKGSESCEHSSLEDFEESDNSLAADSTDDEDLTPSPKAGPSKEPTRQVPKANNRKKREDFSSHAAPKKRFKCNKCERSYTRKGSLTFHLKHECGIEPQFTCTQCNRQFKRKTNLQRHLINFHEIDSKQLNEHGAGLKDQQAMPYKCTKCGISYKQKRTLDHHMKNECGVVFQCNLCTQNYTKKSSLRSHLHNVHKIARRKINKYGTGLKVRPKHPYKCDKCGRTYMLKSSLAHHLTDECGIEPSFTCPRCNCRFIQKGGLKLHLMEIHQVEPSQLAAFGLGAGRPGKQFKCDRCNASYTREGNLKRHLADKCGK